MIEYASIKGIEGEDISLAYKTFVPEFDADKNVIIAPDSGDQVTSINQSQIFVRVKASGEPYADELYLTKQS